MHPGVYTPHDYLEPTYACTSESRIPKAVGDGPTWVCGITALPSPCTLLSLGSNFDDTFERAVHARAACSAYIIDPTLGRKGTVSSVVRSESVSSFETRLSAYGAKLNSSVGVDDPSQPAPFWVVAIDALLRDHYGPPEWRIHMMKIDVEGNPNPNPNPNLPPWRLLGMKIDVGGNPKPNPFRNPKPKPNGPPPWRLHMMKIDVDAP